MQIQNIQTKSINKYQISRNTKLIQNSNTKLIPNKQKYKSQF